MTTATHPTHSVTAAFSRLDRILCSQGDGTGTYEQNVAGVAITAATNADPIVATAEGHGYSDGDLVFIDGGTGLTTINGLRVVTEKTTDTFKLYDTAGDSVAGDGAFGGTVDTNLAFWVKPSATQTFSLERMNIVAGDASAAIVDGMIGVARLSNGIIVALYRGTTLVQLLTPIPVKGWNDWNLAAGVDAGLTDILANSYDAACRWTFSKTSPPIKLSGAAGESIVMYSQDDLDGLSALRAAVQGTVA